MGPSKGPLGSPCGPPLSDRVLTQFRLDSDSSIDSAGLADPYLCQNTDLCPLFHPVSFSLNNGELACPTVWCSTNTTSLTCTACLWLCRSLFYACMFPRCLISHFLDQASHMPVRGVCVCLCWVLVSRPVRM